jgi:outer membrane protein OmpA-like peptidoglycan-associated protein
MIDAEQEQVASVDDSQAPATVERQPTVEVTQERFELVRPSTLASAPQPELVSTERPLTEPPALSRGVNIAPVSAEVDDAPSGLPDLQVAAEDIALLPGPGESIVQLPNSQGYRILFRPGSEDLTTAGGSLLVGLAQRMTTDPNLWIQIRAFATDAAGRPSNSRSLSLNRALLIRSFLIDRGVRSTRVDIRALGNTAESGPRDRVDLIFSN